MRSDITCEIVYVVVFASVQLAEIHWDTPKDLDSSSWWFQQTTEWEQPIPGGSWPWTDQWDARYIYPTSYHENQPSM